MTAVGQAHRKHEVRGERWWAKRWVIAGILLGGVLAIQWSAGAFRSERGLYSDEAAHFMNGLLIRDYAREGLGTNPMAFARDYYQAYPKIAPLMWPPLFHAALGVALVPGWAPMPVAILLLGGCLAWTAWRLYVVTLEFASVPVAIGVTGLFVVTPAVVGLASSVMIDSVIAMLAIEAMWRLARYFETSRLRHAALFGVMAALACLAKGNGISVILAPAFLIGLTRRFDVLLRGGLYLAAAIVVALAVPFLAVAYHLDGSLGDFGPLTPRLIWDRLLFYSTHVRLQLGVLPVLFAGAGLASVVRTPAWLGPRGAMQLAALLALVLGTFTFHLLSPHLLSHERYIALALAPILGLAAHGVTVVSRPLRSPAVRWTMQVAIFVVMVVSNTAQAWPAAQRPLGYRSVAAYLEAQSLAGRRVLVVSDEHGEGAGVAEIAVRTLRPRPMVIRGSKLLASDDWMGRHPVVKYPSPDAILADLESMHVEFVVLDVSPEARALPYWASVQAMATRFPDRVSPVFSPGFDVEHGPIRLLQVYRLTAIPPGDARPVPSALPATAASLDALAP